VSFGCPETEKTATALCYEIEPKYLPKYMLYQSFAAVSFGARPIFSLAMSHSGDPQQNK
jgi:hypothetical protein